MDTEKLYDRDAFLKEFDAVVTDCRPGKGDTYLVTLDRTAFYPDDSSFHQQYDSALRR